MIRVSRHAPCVLETHLAGVQREGVLGIPIAVEDILQLLSHIVLGLAADTLEHSAYTWNRRSSYKRRSLGRRQESQRIERALLGFVRLERRQKRRQLHRRIAGDLLLVQFPREAKCTECRLTGRVDEVIARPIARADIRRHIGDHVFIVIYPRERYAIQVRIRGYDESSL